MPRKSMCRRADGQPKKRCKDFRAALDHKIELIRQGAFADQLHCYECVECGMWHVGRDFRPTERRRKVGKASTA